MWLKRTKKTTISTMPIALHRKNTHRTDAPLNAREESIGKPGTPDRMTVGVERVGSPPHYTDGRHTHQLHKGATHEKTSHSESGRARRHQTTRLANRSSRDCRLRPADINPWAIPRNARTSVPCHDSRSGRDAACIERSALGRNTDRRRQSVPGNTSPWLWVAWLSICSGVRGHTPEPPPNTPSEATRTQRTCSLDFGVNVPLPLKGKLFAGTVGGRRSTTSCARRTAASSIGTNRDFHCTGRRLRQAIGLIGFTSDPLMRYVFRSWLRSVCKGFHSLLRNDQIAYLNTFVADGRGWLRNNHQFNLRLVFSAEVAGEDGCFLNGCHLDAFRYVFRSCLRNVCAGLCEFRPVKRILVRPALPSLETSTRHNFQVPSQLYESSFWYSGTEPFMDAWWLDAKQSGYGGRTAEQLDDFKISHAPIIRYSSYFSQ